LAFFLANQKYFKKLMKKNSIYQKLKKLLFEKIKLITTKLLCPHKII